MSQKKSKASDELSGWDTTVVEGKGILLRFLHPGAKPDQFEAGPWITLTAEHAQALSEELLRQSKRI